MSLEIELNKIIEKRRAVYKLDIPIVALLLLGGVSQTYAPFFVPLFGLIAFALFYRKLLEAAHFPCPKCFQSFGAKTKFVFGVGTDQCQNCGLSIHQTK